MNIAILGTGHVAAQLGAGLAAAGHDIRFGSREPASAAGVDLPVVDHHAAIAPADVVVNALPGPVTLDFIGQLDAGVLAGKVLLDLTNAVTPQFELMYPNESVGELLQELLPETKVVKTLNTVPAEHMVDPGALATTSVFLSGDDAEAKATIRALLVDLGWDADGVLDLGGIATARGTEHYFFLFFAIVSAVGARDMNIAVVRAA